MSSKETTTPSTNDVLKEIFEKVDADASGTIEKKELMKALMFDEKVSTIVHQFDHLIPLLKPKHFEEAFMEMNTAHDNHVTVDEFISFASGLTMKETLTKIFVIIDKEKTGKIDKTECLSNLSSNEDILKLIQQYKS
eukprot:g12100.t1